MYTHNIVIANHVSRAVMRFANACSFAAGGIVYIFADILILLLLLLLLLLLFLLLLLYILGGFAQRAS